MEWDIWLSAKFIVIYFYLVWNTLICDFFEGMNPLVCVCSFVALKSEKVNVPVLAWMMSLTRSANKSRHLLSIRREKRKYMWKKCVFPKYAHHFFRQKSFRGHKTREWRHQLRNLFPAFSAFHFLFVFGYFIFILFIYSSLFVYFK